MLVLRCSKKLDKDFQRLISGLNQNKIFCYRPWPPRLPSKPQSCPEHTHTNCCPDCGVRVNKHNCYDSASINICHIEVHFVCLCEVKILPGKNQNGPCSSSPWGPLHRNRLMQVFPVQEIDKQKT